MELDLVLPGLLGASVHYVDRERTRSYESAILRAFGERATMGRALSDVLSRLEMPRRSAETFHVEHARRSYSQVTTWVPVQPVLSHSTESVSDAAFPKHQAFS